MPRINKGKKAVVVVQTKKKRATRQKKNQNRQMKVKTANVGKVAVMRNPPPVRKMLKNGNVLIKHQEFLAKIPGSVNFSCNAYAVNPGVPASFPWLSPIANQHESYRFRKLEYIFVNSKAGTFAGDIIMGMDYDAADDTPDNELALSNYMNSKTGQICQPLKWSADKQALHKLGPSRYVRLGALAGDEEDIKTYDSGNFFIATTDCADTSTIGRLFVRYEVELMTPQLNPGNILCCKQDVVGVSAAAPLGTSFTSTGSLGVTWLSGTTFSINVPGQYLVYMKGTGTGVTTALNISAATAPSAFNSINTSTNGAGTASMAVSLVKVVNAGDAFTVAVTATTLTQSLIRIAPFTYSLS
jgi:hypothetical protein